MFHVGVVLAILATCHDVQAKPAANPTVPPPAATPSSASTTPFFAAPPASLGVPADLTAGPYFATDFLQAFFPGF
jgi:sphingomyelin phosphodiesterase